MATEAAVITATLAAINAGLPATVRVYEPGKVPKNRPNDYLTVTIVRRAGGSARAGRFTRTGWAVYILAASSNSAADARNSLRLARVAIESKPLTVAGEKSTPVAFYTARQVTPDDNWYSGVDTFHFTI